MATRDYSLLGETGRLAVERGLASATWYRTPVARSRMKELMQRSDARAMRDTVIYLGLLVVFGVAAALLWPSWWAAVPLVGYGLLYGSAGDSRWHECGHGTAFRTPWMNDVVYQIACFTMMRDPVVWKWSHARHHTDTVIVGRDPEIITPRPPKLLAVVLNLVGITDVRIAAQQMLLHASGRLTPEQRTFVPETEWHKTYRTARIWLAIYAAVIALAIATTSWLPVMLIGLPRFYGCWHMVLCGWQQHLGLADDVLDHRLNTRSVLMNPISRFLYWNMNYHVEHHMFPLVPFHALPALHAEIRADLPAPLPNQLAALREVAGTLMRQRRDAEHFIRRTLPAPVTPAP